VLTFKALLSRCADRPQSTFPPGWVVLEEGKKTGVLYVLESGTVEVSKEGETIDIVSQAGAVFGEVSALLGTPHIATVRVTTESRFRVIADPLRFLEQNSDVALHVAALLARRLTAVTAYLIDIKQQFAGREDHLGMVDKVLHGLLHMQLKPTTRSPRDEAL
jgi:CRP/FNR family cyclic AMP-dependent transcriptional regulator